ncbi:SHOCT domain-containing protein [Mycolicibacterium komossense]|uniref:SHOCT domain-containing protein n=1 Tax=Mycolicibacterium komossense TaxID=1779 RepID=A0ABT3CE49_9MYCO|nr:SHOCT domain-containing protein [Mycolicibacterium komossense]MCV7227666.1 SHOCT domain-containing protein [Mycolicibacterium komossense]
MSLLRTVRRAAVASAVHGKVQRRQHERWAAQPAAPAAQPAVTEPGDLLSQLERLGQLRDSGVLSDDEFASQKARLLG